jgi:hypothetical protein
VDSSSTGSEFVTVELTVKVGDEVLYSGKELLLRKQAVSERGKDLVGRSAMTLILGALTWHDRWVREQADVPQEPAG